MLTKSGKPKRLSGRSAWGKQAQNPSSQVLKPTISPIDPASYMVGLQFERIHLVSSSFAFPWHHQTSPPPPGPKKIQKVPAPKKRRLARSRSVRPSHAPGSPGARAQAQAASSLEAWQRCVPGFEMPSQGPGRFCRIYWGIPKQWRPPGRVVCVWVSN